MKDSHLLADNVAIIHQLFKTRLFVNFWDVTEYYHHLVLTFTCHAALLNVKKLIRAADRPHANTSQLFTLVYTPL